MLIKAKITTVIAAALLISASAFANEGEHFKEMDTNSDGRISTAEHEAAGMTKFSKADKNADGMLTKDELSGFMIEEKGKSEARADKKSDKKVNKFDQNGDGQLTKQEFIDGSKSNFSKLDSNSDGAVTQEEMQARKDKMKDKM